MKNKLAFLFLISLPLAFCEQIKAQIVQDIAGRPLIPNKYAEIKGDIYFNENWSKGYVISADGKKNNTYFLKYDEIEDVPVYLSKEEAYTFVDRIIEFSLIDDSGIAVIFRNGFKPSSKTTEQSYFQVIYDGDIKLLKKNIKNIIEDREYNSATTVKKITTSPLYFLIDYSQNIIQIKRDTKSILGVLGKNEAVSNYMKENKLDLKKDPDLIKLLTFYSTIIKK
ncbi:hypothetical protein [Pedobacter zeae]|uniref:Uncharacterized protein n=1 Tax=Pedobacter zeae TaxID=1737356 RepID=A0A7W6KDI1_9SPHI|nr:hypothetical protein [Pedobacter zeae]MBB4109617.1 hypothetical protein [Pedobacter zeae]GGH13256.1 hypothetical protein GCM10007422_33760 [Pedobacter zeae]